MNTRAKQILMGSSDLEAGHSTRCALHFWCILTTHCCFSFRGTCLTTHCLLQSFLRNSGSVLVRVLLLLVECLRFPLFRGWKFSWLARGDRSRIRRISISSDEVESKFRFNSYEGMQQQSISSTLIGPVSDRICLDSFCFSCPAFLPTIVAAKLRLSAWICCPHTLHGAQQLADEEIQRRFPGFVSQRSLQFSLDQCLDSESRLSLTEPVLAEFVFHRTTLRFRMLKTCPVE